MENLTHEVPSILHASPTVHACTQCGRPEREFSKSCYTHAVEKLVGLAKLDSDRKVATQADLDLLANWALVANWSEEKRYHRIDRTEAEARYAAITEPVHGALPWIKTHW